MRFVSPLAGYRQAFVSDNQAALGDEVFEDKCGEKPVSHRKIEDFHAANSRIGEEGQSGGLCGMILMKDLILFTYLFLYFLHVTLIELMPLWIPGLYASLAAFCKFLALYCHSNG